MKRVLRAIGWGVVAYVVSAFAGYFLVAALSGNTHDPGVEAAMTGVFVIGPLGGVIATIVSFLRNGSGGQVERR